MAFWSVIRCHPNSEKIAIRNLVNQEFDYYQPLLLERKIRKQKAQLVEVPLFPCYLFVKIVDRWMSLQSTYGVAKIIQSGPMPAMVRDEVIDDLRSREHNGYIQLPKPDEFKVGDKVRIGAGIFEGREALVDRMPPKERQKILLMLLGSQIKVLVAAEDLQAA